MDSQAILNDVKAKFTKAVEHFQNELKKIRTGRASPAMLDGLMIEAYGAKVPLLQVASVAAPEAQLLQLTPFDPNNLQTIAAAIRENQDLGLNPVDDGRVIRIQIPPLTTERREQIAKQLSSKVEECMVQMRGARHEALKGADEAKKAKELTEDDYTWLHKHIDEAMQEQKKHIDELTKAKEQEILTV
jgi:ribosome recycling factor